MHKIDINFCKIRLHMKIYPLIIYNLLLSEPNSGSQSFNRMWRPLRHTVTDELFHMFWLIPA